jgi:hypothetical protein
MPKNRWALQYVTITGQIIVYAPAERAETFSVFPLSPSLLCGVTHWAHYEGTIDYEVKVQGAAT